MSEDRYFIFSTGPDGMHAQEMSKAELTDPRAFLASTLAG